MPSGSFGAYRNETVVAFQLILPVTVLNGLNIGGCGVGLVFVKTKPVGKFIRSFYHQGHKFLLDPFVSESDRRT